MTAVRRDPFDGLFVLELANNHRGSLERGLRIVEEFGRVARWGNVRCAIKLQVRDVDSFIHPAFRTRTDLRYVRRTTENRLPDADFAPLVATIRQHNCIPAATAFDERSVEFCRRLGIEILKLASSDIADWPLIEAVAATRLPVIASCGGASEKDTDDLVSYFARRGIPLALNHCVALYPTAPHDLDLNQIDYLRKRYPRTTIGFSTHQQADLALASAVAWAKGARTFERHIDLPPDAAPYCSSPAEIADWFATLARVRAMSGPPGVAKRIPGPAEVQYLDALVRGVYAARDLPAGTVLAESDLALQIPLQKAQLSCREFVRGERLARDVKAGEALTLDAIGASGNLAPVVAQRGI